MSVRFRRISYRLIITTSAAAVLLLMMLFNVVSAQSFIDCSSCHVERLSQFSVTQTEPTNACALCHMNLVPGQCDSGTISTPYGYFKSPAINMDGQAVHADHAGVNPRAIESDCSRCHAQVDCRTCHEQVPHEEHGSFFIGPPVDLLVTNGYALFWTASSCASARCHATVQNSYLSKGAVEAVSQLDWQSQDIEVDGNPRGIAFSGATNTLIVAGYTSNLVTVIDANPESPQFNTVLQTIPVGRNPYGVAVDDARGLAYITNSGDDSLSVISLTSGTVICQTTVGCEPRGVAVNQMTGRVFVGLEGESRIAVIDPMAGFQVVNSINLPSNRARPQTLAIDEATNTLMVSYSDAEDPMLYYIGAYDNTYAYEYWRWETPNVQALGFAVDSARNLVYTATQYDLTLIDKTNGSVVGHVTTGYIWAEEASVCYDGSTDNVCIVSRSYDGSCALSVIDANTKSIIMTKPAKQQSMAVAAGANYLYVTGGSSTLVPEPRPSCLECHIASQSEEHETLHTPNPSVVGSSCEPCHMDNIVSEHSLRGFICETCHLGQGPSLGEIALQVIAAYDGSGKTDEDKAGCQDCHLAVSGTKGDPASLENSNHIDLHSADPAIEGTACVGCHVNNLVSEHVTRIDPDTDQPYGCMACHGDSASYQVKNAISLYVFTGEKAGCADCHEGVAPDLSINSNHVALHSSQEVEEGCLIDGCHASDNTYYEHEALGGTCLTCHPVYTGTKIDPAVVAQAIVDKNPNCSACHDIHGDIPTIHLATNIGTVYRDYACTKCHFEQTIDEHKKPGSSTTSASCQACHPDPRKSITEWGKSCSEGDCHTAATGPGSVHTEDSVKHTSASTCTNCHRHTNKDVSIVHALTIAKNGTSGCGISNIYGGCHTSPDVLPAVTQCEVCHPDKLASHPGKCKCKQCNRYRFGR